MKMEQIILLLSLVWLFCWTTTLAQTIPPTLHARIIQLEDERNLNGDELAKLLKHASPKVRERAALAIGRIGDKRGTAALIALLESEKDEAVRAMTVFALGEMEDAAAVPVLLEFLTPGKYPIAVRARPVEALGKIAGVPANIELLGKATLDQISNRLIEQLPNPEFTLTADKRPTANLTITALMRVRSAASVEPLARQLKSTDVDIRAQTANALARIRQPIAAAVPALLEALNDSDHNVRANAARALGVSKDARAVEPLIKLLGDKSEQVQVSAIRALTAIGDKTASPAIIKKGEELFQRNDSQSSISLLLEVAASLGQLKADTALPLLHKIRQQHRVGSYVELEIAVGRFGEKEVLADGGQELLSDDVADLERFSVLAQGISESGSELGKEMLLRTLTGSWWEQRSQTLQALAKMKPASLPFILRDELKSGDVFDRANAASLIAGLIDDKNLDALLESLTFSKLEDKVNDAKLAILTALSKYKSEKGVEAIKTALNDSDHLVRRRAVDLLKQAGAGDFSDRIGIVKTNHDKLFYQRVVARMNKKVTATLHTDKGAVTMELFPAEAPITVDSFVRLARKGYFNDLTFHRVVPNFVIQGGDPRGDGEGGPGYQIRCEVNSRAYGRGAVGMALSGKDTGGSQFFMTHSPQPHLDGGYTVLGQVTSGLDVVDRIARGDTIKRIVIVEK